MDSVEHDMRYSAKMQRLLFLVLFLTLFPALGQTRRVTDAEVMRVHKSALLMDLHNDITSDTVNGADIGKHGPLPGSTRKILRHTDIGRLQKGGVGALFFSVYVSGEYVATNRSAHRGLEMLDTARHDIIARYPGTFQPALSAADIEAARRNGKIAALMGLEGGHAIQDSLRLLRSFYALGIRYMTLTHSNTNNWADSSGDIARKSVKHHNGLTDFGKDVVREMNRLGMMVDISHVADKTFWDALSISTAPMIASHSSARALAPIPRNMTDDMITALAKKGGVIHINFGCSFISPRAAEVSLRLQRKTDEAEDHLANQPEKLREQRRRLAAEARNESVRATLAETVAHIDHVVKIAGVDAVGIGSDYDGVTCVPEGLDDVSQFPNLTRALLERGYSEENIRKIYGGNTLRVMRAVEKAAGR